MRTTGQSGVTATAEQLERIQSAMWAQVVAEFPEVQAGDLEALQQHRLTEAIGDTVNSWLLNNHPGNREWDPETDPLPEPCTSSNGLECMHPDHDHRYGAGIVEPENENRELLCEDCGCPLFWDGRTQRYWHTDVAAPACFLVSARS